jgi:hypothetical protein
LQLAFVVTFIAAKLVAVALACTAEPTLMPLRVVAVRPASDSTSHIAAASSSVVVTVQDCSQ